MGNTHCNCYSHNKKICKHCSVKYCGKCLLDKKSTPHFHPARCCGVNVNLDSLVHECSCTRCGKTSFKILTSYSICDPCALKYKLFPCVKCNKQLPIGEIHNCNCLRCNFSITVSAHRECYCDVCSQKICIKCGGKSHNYCDKCQLSSYYDDDERDRHSSDRGGIFGTGIW